MVENNIKVGGAVVFWSVCEWTDRLKLEQGLQGAGYGDHVPPPRTPFQALKESLAEAFSGRDFRVEATAEELSFEVVQVKRRQGQNEYVHQRRVWLDDQKRVNVDPFQQATAENIVRGYNRHLGLLRAGQVTGALVSIVEGLGGCRLRPKGSIYWLPEDRLAGWLGAAGAAEKAAASGQTSVYCLRHQMDADAVRAVRDAIVAQVSGEVARIDAEVGSGTLGERALEHRQEEALALRETIRLYEGLLDTGLVGLRAAVDRVEMAAAEAALLAAAQAGRQEVPA